MIFPGKQVVIEIKFDFLMASNGNWSACEIVELASVVSDVNDIYRTIIRLKIRINLIKCWL